MRYHNIDGTDFAMLFFISCLGAFLITLGVIILVYADDVTPIPVAGMAIGGGSTLTGMINVTITRDIIKAYKAEVKRRESEHITRNEPWREEHT